MPALAEAGKVRFLVQTDSCARMVREHCGPQTQVAVIGLETARRFPERSKDLITRMLDPNWLPASALETDSATGSSTKTTPVLTPWSGPRTSYGELVTPRSELVDVANRGRLASPTMSDPRRISPSLLLAISVSTAALAGQAAKNQGGTPTFSEHIAPIVFNKCTSCHRPDQIGPFHLLNYKQVRRRAKMIRKVTKSRFMPPWHPVAGHGDFVSENRLTQAEIDLIGRWVAAGTPEGNKSKLPPVPKFVDGWALGKPDMIVKMAKGFTVPAGGRDIYRNFAIPMNLQERKWLTAIEVRASAPAVLHHILFVIDTTMDARRKDGRDGRPGFSGMRGAQRNARDRVGNDIAGLGGWAVGGQPRHLPMGLGRELPKGEFDLVLNAHLHPSGKEEVEQTTLALYFAKKKPSHRMVSLSMPPNFGIAAGINIPAGEKNYVVKDSFTLPVDSLGLTVGGHAHYLGKEMKMFVTRPGGQRESVFWIDNWAFNWQNRYQYKKPLDLPAGTKIEMEIVFDNSKDNPSNPFDPPRRVGWGLQSTEEMAGISLLLISKDKYKSRKLAREIRNARNRGMRSENMIAGMIGQMASRIRDYDKDGDGFVELSDLPQSYQRFVGRFDRDGDGKLSSKEIDDIGR